MTKRRDQSFHDRMVKSVADHCRSDGHGEVRADIKGYESPERIFWEASGEGHIPDVTSSLRGTEYIFEVETDDSIGTEHTDSQFKLFAANAAEHGKQFVVVVPKGQEDKAKRQLASLGITAEVWTYGN